MSFATPDDAKLFKKQKPVREQMYKEYVAPMSSESERNSEDDYVPETVNKRTKKQKQKLAQRVTR